MIERAIITAALLVVGFLVYRAFSRQHVRRAAASAPTDPLLTGLKPGVPAIVYFTTPGCVPCKTQQQPALAKLQSEMGDFIQIIQVDAAQDPDAAERWGVFSAPTTFILDRSGQPREVNHGVADTSKLKRQLAQVA